MSVVTGLPHLVRGVKDYFTLYSVDAEVRIGMRERPKQINQGPGGANRVVFQPGDDAGNAGLLSAPMYPGEDSILSGDQLVVDTSRPRPLSNWEELTTCYVWGVDIDTGDALADEERQYIATRDLFQWVRRAVYDVAEADIVMGAVRWAITPIEHRFGFELAAQIVYRSPLIDVESELRHPENREILKEF